MKDTLERRLFSLRSPSALCQRPNYLLPSSVVRGLDLQIDRVLELRDNDLASDLIGSVVSDSVASSSTSFSCATCRSPLQKMYDSLCRSNADADADAKTSVVATRSAMRGWSPRARLDALLLSDIRPPCKIPHVKGTHGSTFSDHARQNFESWLDAHPTKSATRDSYRVLDNERSWREGGVPYTYETAFVGDSADDAASVEAAVYACVAARLGSGVPLLRLERAPLDSGRPFVSTRVLPETTLHHQLSQTIELVESSSAVQLMLYRILSWKKCVQSMSDVGMVHLGVNGSNLLQGSVLRRSHGQTIEQDDSLLDSPLCISPSETILGVGPTYVRDFAPGDVSVVNLDSSMCSTLMNSLVIFDLYANDDGGAMSKSLCIVADLFAQNITSALTTRNSQSTPTRNFLRLMDTCWKTTYADAVRFSPDDSAVVGVRAASGEDETKAVFEALQRAHSDDVSVSAHPRLSGQLPRLASRSDVAFALQTTHRLYDSVRRVAEAKTASSECGPQRVRAWCTRVPVVNSALELAAACLQKMATA